MEKTFDIFFHDLVPETQKEVLKFLGSEKPEDENFDVFPLTVISREDTEEFLTAIKSRRKEKEV